ncbi:MAG TPA: thioredoxin domain-containing protein [Thermoanaerobaculia bacterium]|nr:thioredoxin domain-containing protein [Thermoanaerobaculia bacterium]
MKRALLVISLFLCAAAAQAQFRPSTTDQTATLRDYAAKVLPRCPNGVVTLEPVRSAGPTNFTAYVATVRSDDKYCGTQKYVLHSPKTQQMLIGTVIPVPKDGRPTATRFSEKSTELLGKPVKAIIAPFPLQDGIKAVNITRETPYGAFSYAGFIDQSEAFLIVGFRGNLLTDPAKTLRETLGTTTGARRGTGKVEILELSDFQCPTCARAHENIEPIIQKNLGKMSYIRIDLPLFEHHEWAIPAAMGARAIQRVAPAKYWQYVDYVFKNQETIGKRKFDDVLKEFIEDNDIDAAAIQKIYGSKAERQTLLDQVSRAFAAGIASTPTFIVNGQIMGFGPEGSFTIEQIKSAIGVSTPAKKAAAKK